MYLPRKVELGALYLRKSRQDIKFEKRTGENTLESQRVLMHNFLSGMDIPYESFEEIVSASSIEKRKKIKRIIKGIEEEKYDAIVVKDISRLSRGSQKDAGYLYEMFTKYEILIITPSKVYDCTNKDDLKMLRMEMFLFHEEWQMIRERMVGGRRLAAERGFYVGGIIPYGFKVDRETKRLILDENQSEVVDKIYNYYVNQGFGYQKIANLLNEERIPSPNGTLWGKSTIKRILGNEIYSGVQIFGKRKLKGNQLKLQPEEAWIKSEMNVQLVDDELFKQAQDKSKIPSAYDPDTYHLAHPLSKLITCGRCGKNIMRKHIKSYYTTTEGEKRVYFSYVLACCHGYIKYDKVLDQLIAILEEYGNIDERRLQNKLSKHLHDQTANSDNDILEDIEEIQKRIKRVQELRLFLYDKYAEEDSGVDDFIYETKNNAYIKQIHELEARLDHLKKVQKEEKKEVPRIDMEKIQIQIRSVLDAFEKLEAPYQNQLLQFLFESVTLHITERKKGTHSKFKLDVILRLPFSK